MSYTEEILRRLRERGPMSVEQFFVDAAVGPQQGRKLLTEMMEHGLVNVTIEDYRNIAAAKLFGDEDEDVAALCRMVDTKMEEPA